MIKNEKGKMDLTANLAYLEGNMNFLNSADRYSDTAQEVIEETKDLLIKLRVGLYKTHNHYLEV